MDHDLDHDLDVLDPPAIDLPVESGDGGGGLVPPDEGTGGGGGRRSGDPFLHSHWSALIPVGLILLFGLQSLMVLWVARAGMGSEATAWLLAGTFVLSFTVVFILGSRFIARHRN